MSLFRFILGVLIALSLAAAPVVAAMAMPAMAAEHCAKKEMGACDCCGKANHCRSDVCACKCFKVPADIVAATRSFDVGSSERPDSGARLMPLGNWPPATPPPRT